MKRFMNPFYKIAGWKAFGYGILFLLATGILGGVFNVQFDGIIDVEPLEKVGIVSALLANILNWMLLVLVFGGATVIMNGWKFRLIDLLGLMAFVRIPFVILPPAAHLFKIEELTSELMNNISVQGVETVFTPANIAYLSFFILLVFLVVILSVTWMFNGFRLLSNSKGYSTNLIFITAVIVGEVLSKFLINWLFL